MWLPLLFVAAFVGPCKAQERLIFDGTAYTVTCGHKRFHLYIDGQNEESYCAVRQVPYATAKRFERPQALNNEQRAERQGNRTSYLSAGNMGCVQVDPFTGQVNGTEDCLTVDLYVPQDFFSSEQEAKREIFVIIEGLEMKSYLGPYLRPSHGFGKLDYILAVVHYRTGVLGFLSVEDEFSPANLGLLDQQMALEFLHNQSAVLKAVKGRIVLLGFGSGAAAVSLHMANPVSKKFFDRALLSGGSALSPDATVIRPWLNAYYLAKQLKCKLDNKNTIINCLKYEKNSTALVKAAADSPGYIRFAAFVDGGGQPKNTSDGSHIAQQKVFISKPVHELILATDFAEGIKSIAYGYPTQAGLNHFIKANQRKYTGDDIEYIKQFFKDYFKTTEAYEPSLNAVVEVAYRQYVMSEKSFSALGATKMYKRIIDMLTDFLIGGPMQNVIMSTLRNNRTELIYSYLLIPPPLLPATATRLSLINYLYETKDFPNTTEINSYGASLDDLFFFIGCDAFSYINQEEPSLEKRVLQMSSEFGTLLECLRASPDCMATYSNVKFPGDKGAVFGKQNSLYNALQSIIDESPKKVYRYDFNNFWTSIQFLMVGFENSLDRERQLKIHIKRQTIDTRDKLQAARWKEWSLIAVIIVTSVIVIVMILVVIKLITDRKHRDSFEAAVKGMDRVNTGSTRMASE